jgi:trimethylamine:corrinoid methyltransferase-like protein
MRAYLKVNSIARVKGCIDKMAGYIKMRESMKEKCECWWMINFTVPLTYGLGM